ncbi:hypothetical protein [uncultured Sphingomonas sp.]|uniref:hypothetical protein n=1 Tax=uncultured Sphingomonas sp. TaxID=158754 RepID=UPI0025E2CE48|nr:hypothetical protein [uncultured Sphingomonas sp.]
MRLKIPALVLFICTPVMAYSGGNHQDVQVSKKLTVWGPKAGVTRFLALQGALKPALAVSAPKSLGTDKAEATVTLPAGYKGEDVVHTTREALAAGLWYKYEERRSAVTTRS